MRVIFLIACFAGLQPCSGAIEVSYLATSGLRDVASPIHLPLAAGHEVRLGTFEDGFTPPAGATPADLGAQWRAFDVTEVREIDGEPSRFGAEASSTDSFFEGRNIWMWVLRTTDALAVEADYSNVTAQGLYRADSGWTFPTGGGLPGQNRLTITSSEADISPIGSLTDASLLLETTGAVLPGYADWAAVELADFPAKNGADEDADGDGLSNGLEFFLQTEATTPTAPPLQTANTNDFFSVSFDLPDDGREQYLIVKSSMDLSTFQKATPAASRTVTGDGMVRLTLDFPKASDRLFVRLDLNLD